ncbi:hypothetical protein JPFTNV_09460 [Francisella tularensis subsp. holarctica]|nr:hypothetical protein JPFTNV_09460 [Francisella tularensis subsp. holarctica]BCL55084.1 hypothetical protein JPFTKU_08980 [Francisella tularensis subsp. holarctica]
MIGGHGAIGANSDFSAFAINFLLVMFIIPPLRIKMLGIELTNTINLPINLWIIKFIICEYMR